MRSRDISLLTCLITILITSCGQLKSKDNPAYAISEQYKPLPDSAEIIKLRTSTRFRFKGLAIDVQNHNAYLGSWDKQEIVTVNLLNGVHQTLKTKYSGKLNGMGCAIKKSRLYTVMNEVNDNPNTPSISVLLVFDLKSNQLLRSYESTGIHGRNHFNHLVVDDNGIAYISNTLKSCVNFVDTTIPDGKIQILVEHKDLAWVHGIDLNEEGTKLFTTSYNGGVRFFDLNKKTFSSFRDTTLAGDDGLKYYKGHLYGVGQNMIKRYTLNHDQTSITKTDIILKDHEYFNDPRCLHIENGFLYCLANMEFEPVIFRGQKRSSRSTALDDSYLIKMKLE